MAQVDRMLEMTVTIVRTFCLQYLFGRPVILPLFSNVLLDLGQGSERNSLGI